MTFFHFTIIKGIFYIDCRLKPIQKTYSIITFSTELYSETNLLEDCIANNRKNGSIREKNAKMQILTYLPEAKFFFQNLFYFTGLLFEVDSTSWQNIRVSYVEDTTPPP